MKGKKYIRDIMFENIQAEHAEEVRQGDILKELADSKTRQTNYIKEAKIYGAKYFTEDKLEQIHRDAEEYLLLHIDIDSIKEKVNGTSNLDIGVLEELYNIENKIAEVKMTLDKCDVSLSEDNNSIQSLIVGLVDRINGDRDNEN